MVYAFWTVRSAACNSSVFVFCLLNAKANVKQCRLWGYYEWVWTWKEAVSFKVLSVKCPVSI
jgi:hypothetical protein